MEWNRKKFNKEKHLFRSYYCVGCKQVKPCGVLGWEENCCSCYFQSWQARNQEYLDYQVTYQQEVKEQKENFQQLQLLKSYQGCSQCRSKEIDAYDLYAENKLVCRPCLIKKEGGSSGPISFSEKMKWHKKYWGINLNEWLENFSQLPVNKNCAKEWLKDSQHLKNCQCLAKKVQEIVEFYTNSLKEYQEKLRKCSCEKSEKVRISDDDYAWCEICDQTIAVASKKRVIKNRNDPRFWGLSINEKVLCGNCLESKKEGMPPLRKAEFNRYRKTGRL